MARHAVTLLACNRQVRVVSQKGQPFCRCKAAISCLHMMLGRLTRMLWYYL